MLHGPQSQHLRGRHQGRDGGDGQEPGGGGRCVTCHVLSRVTSCHVSRIADDEDQDSAVYHRQAVHFLAKQDYPSALAAVERARMIALGSLDQVYLENYNIYNKHL